jgi:hypothetical protein
MFIFAALVSISDSKKSVFYFNFSSKKEKLIFKCYQFNISDDKQLINDTVLLPNFFRTRTEAYPYRTEAYSNKCNPNEIKQQQKRHSQ